MKFTTVIIVLLALVVGMYVYKPALFNRITGAISGKFVAEMKQISKPVSKGQKTKNERLQEVDQP